MADGKVLIELQLIQKGDSIQLVQQQTEKLTKSQDKLTKSKERGAKATDKYNRREKGTAQISSNQTKNFSKMQQSIDGGGGSGGLVRAYALLAANVFALSAAFGILSRASEVDSLIASMEQLEITSGKSIKAVARDLQSASGFGMDFAASLRSTSLALSAGFESEQILQLGEVAKNAAVSLGRNVPDALDRIFRGVIKVEPELLDEIGLFVRVNEASQKYAATLGVAVGDLTEFQRRQAFLNEAIEQGEKKFQAFGSIDVNPYAQLATTFADVTQGILSAANAIAGFFAKTLAENKFLFTGLFGILVFTLLKLAVPAMGSFTASIAANAVAAKKAADAAVNNSNVKAQAARKEHIEFLKNKKKELEILAQQQRMTEKPVQLAVGGRQASRTLEKQLQDQSIKGAERQALLEQRISAIKTERGLKQRMQNTQVKQELALLEAELATLRQINQVQRDIDTPGVSGATSSSFSMMMQQRATRGQIEAEGLAGIASIAESEGALAAFGSINGQLKVMEASAGKAGIKLGFVSKNLFRIKSAGIAAAVGIQTLTMRLMPYISAFLILVPLLQGFGKLFLGTGSSEAKAVSDANRDAAEAFETLGAKIDHATTKYKEFLEVANFREANRATAALKEATATTVESLQKQIDAFDSYSTEAGAIAQTFEERFFEFFGEGTVQRIGRNRKALINELNKIRDQLSDKMNELLTIINLGGPLADEAFEELLDLAIDENKGFKNIVSAIDGARDSAREFGKTLLVSTAIDKPLATFRQLNTALDNALLSETERSNLLNEIINDQNVLNLLTKNQRNALKDIRISDEERLELMEEIEKVFFRQQEILISQKQELKQIKDIQKLIAQSSKLSEASVFAKLTFLEKERALQKEILQFELARKTSATGLTAAEIRLLSARGTLIGAESEFNLSRENMSQVLAAIVAFEELQTFELQEQVRLATQEDTLAKEQLEVRQRLLQLEIDRNKVIIDRLDFAATLDSFNETGTTALNVQERFEKLQAVRDIELTTAERRLEIEQEIVNARFSIMKTELEMTKQRLEFERDEALERMNDPTLTGEQQTEARRTFTNARKAAAMISGSITDLDTALSNTLSKISQLFEKGTDEYNDSLIKLFEGAFPGSTAGDPILATIENARALRDELDEDGNVTKTGLITELLTAGVDQAKIDMAILQTQVLNFASILENTFGENGAFPASLGRASMAILDIFTNLDAVLSDQSSTQGERFQAMASAVSGSVAALQSVYTAFSNNRIKQIEAEIEAEKKRDGKSKESVAKLAALEKKKEMMQRKQFEINKKLMLAQAVASTAAGIAGALNITTPYEFPFATVIAAAIGAMGAAQIALISKLRYDGGVAETPQANATSLTIGKRSNAVDVSRGTSAGELNYLRGGRTTGGDLGGAGMGLPGSAMGRKGYAMGFRRGYADGGIVVGERGPEVITPSADVDIVPNFALGGGETNVNFSINAIDAAGVEDVLMNQQGNIIRMIREAANENGERFLETVDTQTYGSST